MTEDFNKWWDSDWLIDDNPYTQGTPAYWAWAGWQAAMKAERKPLMTDEEYEQAMADQGQRTMLEIDTEVRAMIKEAVDAEREACAALCDKISDDDGFEGGYANYCAHAIRARGNHEN